MEKLTRNALDKTSSYSPSNNPWVQVLMIAVGFTIVEVTKELARPTMTKWQSHIMSIILVAATSAFVIYRYSRIVRRQFEALQAHHVSMQAQLRTVNQGIELIVQERTRELQSEIRGRKQVERRLIMQYEATRLLASSNSVIEAAPKLLAALCDHIDWDYSGLWMVDPEANVMRCLDVFHRQGIGLEHFADMSRETTFVKGVGGPGRVWKSGEAAWIFDVINDSNFPRATLAAKCGLHTSLTFPIFIGGEVVGAFEFLSRDLLKRDEDLLMMRNIGGQIGLLIERTRDQAKLDAMHQELIVASRHAGMAEVATGVLHNVGNALNSVNVSSSLVTGSLKKSKIPSLGKIVALLREHETDLGTFMTSDPRGKLVPDFLAQLASHLAGEQGAALKELQLLQTNIDHIKQIVATQQTHASSAGVFERLDVRQSIEAALQMSMASLARHDIVLVRNFADIPDVPADKHKVLQILVNLISNARQAMAGGASRTLTVKTELAQDSVRVSVRDTGYGIPLENMTRVFAHGFTTKKDGHGFGLHSSALAAKEMKGSLSVQSDGPGRGAVFILELPLAIPDRSAISAELCAA